MSDVTASGGEGPATSGGGPAPRAESPLVKRRWGVFGGGAHGVVVLAVVGAIALGGVDPATDAAAGQPAGDPQEVSSDQQADEAPDR